MQNFRFSSDVDWNWCIFSMVYKMDWNQCEYSKLYKVDWNQCEYWKFYKVFFFLRQPVQKIYYTRNQVPLYSLRIKPILKPILTYTHCFIILLPQLSKKFFLLSTSLIMNQISLSGIFFFSKRKVEGLEMSLFYKKFRKPLNLEIFWNLLVLYLCWKI